jgi:hypothetical protein
LLRCDEAAVLLPQLESAIARDSYVEHCGRSSSSRSTDQEDRLKRCGPSGGRHGCYATRRASNQARTSVISSVEYSARTLAWPRRRSLSTGGTW